MKMTRQELKKTVLSFRNGILGKRESSMMCFVVCAPLQGFLELLGVPTKLIESDFGRVNHVWLEMEDGTIIDPTADQFSTELRPMPKVYIGPKPDWYRTIE